VSRVLDTFLELVRIDSPSGAEAACGRHVARLLADLGMSVGFDNSAGVTGSDSGNLIASLAGTVPGKRLLLSAHLDTVQPGNGVDPVVADGVVSSRGDTVLGADDKAGIAAIVEGVRRIVEAGEPHAAIDVVMTTGEELGLRGAKALDPAVVATAELAIVLDADGMPGGIVDGAPTHYTFVAEFMGRAAHAGVEPQKGRSAIVMAAEAVAAMRLGRVDELSTANIGTMDGGTATNVVAASVRVTGECRSLDPEVVETLRTEMEAAMHDAAARHEGRVDVRWTREYDGYMFTSGDPALEFARAVCRDVGVEPRTFHTGGGSDGNVFASRGVPTLVLSSGMTHVHCTDERIAVADLETLADMVVAALRRAVG
jgi:tripeptide aminopeptidase